MSNDFGLTCIVSVFTLPMKRSTVAFRFASVVLSLAILAFMHAMNKHNASLTCLL